MARVIGANQSEAPRSYQARGFPDRNKPQFIALLGPALKARGAARALPVMMRHGET